METVEISGIEDLQRLLRAGEQDWDRYGAVRAERFEDLILFDYRASAQWDNRWNWFERSSRGLIMNACTGEVVARPFDKFFNWGESGRVSTAPLREVTEKLDGSLGILFRHGGGYRIATRGAFHSEQAQWATEFLNRYDLAGLPEELTLLFEIIYPENRVVIDYGAREDLVLIGARNRFTGQDFFFDEIAALAARFGFSLPPTHQIDSVEAILAAAAELEVQREGWVLRFADGQRFKVKGEAYKLVHRLVTQATFGQVLDAMAKGTLDATLEGIPDEFLGQVKGWQAQIEAKVAEIRERVETIYAAAPRADRKSYALWVRENHPADSAYLFARLDGRDISPLVYRYAFDTQGEEE